MTNLPAVSVGAVPRDGGKPLDPIEVMIVGQKWKLVPHRCRRYPHIVLRDQSTASAKTGLDLAVEFGCLEIGIENCYPIEESEEATSVIRKPCGLVDAIEELADDCHRHEDLVESKFSRMDVAVHKRNDCVGIERSPTIHRNQCFRSPPR